MNKDSEYGLSLLTAGRLNEGITPSACSVAIDAINAGPDVPIVVRQVKYLNNIVEQDHRAIKWVTRPMLNFKSFRAAHCVLAGIEFMHMIRKGQFAINGTDAMSFAGPLAKSHSKNFL